jgi:hypothetical protein
MSWPPFLLLLSLAVLADVSGTARPPPATATIEPVTTSIPLGRVTLTCPPFSRDTPHYRSTYTARVFPYFFLSEHGEIAIEVSDADLERLAAGERVVFTGEAFNHHGDHRHVEGHAAPHDAWSGEIKVRIFVTRRIQLIFNTTYRLAHDPADAASSSPDGFDLEPAAPSA